MTDRPILFSAPMVRALLAGRKTQTRRVIKQPFADGYHAGHLSLDRVNQAEAWARFSADAVGGGAIREEFVNLRHAVGDRLWVREAWRTFVSLDATKPRDLLNGKRGAGVRFEAGGGVSVSVTGERYDTIEGLDDKANAMGKLRPSMFMPRWASRLTLTITGVRVQRLQEISEEDAQAEGAGDPYLGDGDPPFEECTIMVSSWRRFRNLWFVINGPESWKANPYVVAYTFTVEQRNIDA